MRSTAFSPVIGVIGIIVAALMVAAVLAFIINMIRMSRKKPGDDDKR